MRYSGVDQKQAPLRRIKFWSIFSKGICALPPPQKTTEIIPVNIVNSPSEKIMARTVIKAQTEAATCSQGRKPNSDPYKSNTLAVSPSPRFSEQIATYLRLNEPPLSILIRSCLGARSGRLGKIRKISFTTGTSQSARHALWRDPLNPNLNLSISMKWKIFNVLFQSRLTTD